MTDSDALVSDYLRRLELAASGLPADRRAELIEEITAHIAEARAQSQASIAGPESDLLDLLNRLGDPEEIAVAAADAPVLALAGMPDQPAGPGPFTGGAAGQAPGGQAGWRSRHAYRQPAGAPGTLRPAGPGLPASARADTLRPGGLEIAAVSLTIGSAVLLPVVPFAAAVLWLAGIILLWCSSRWRVSDKVLGTVVWPAALGLVVLLVKLSLVPRVRIAGLAVGLAAVVVVAVRLLQQAGRARA